MSLDSILGIVKNSLDKAGLKGLVEIVDNEITITMTGEEIKQTLLKNIPQQYASVFEIKPESKIVIAVKIH